MVEGPPKLPPEEEEKAQRFGGSDTHDYTRPTEPKGSDHQDHHERSVYHQPNHEDHKPHQ
jgi:hypothetical protein